MHVLQLGGRASSDVSRLIKRVTEVKSSNNLHQVPKKEYTPIFDVWRQIRVVFDLK